MTLTQREADTLREIEKAFINPASVRLPERQEKQIYNLWYRRNDRRKDDMAISAFRGKKNPRKVSFRLLYAQGIMLARIDTQDITSHTNPDGTRIEPLEPHIHIYKEGYGDKFAYPLPTEFNHTDDIIGLFMDFLAYSNVINRDQVHLAEPEVLFDGY
ncbi:DUF6978 family protein [uncultured Megasphaera sp.]|uniref:DUF6978 family protein n=1 Tax=uncultured Megasphaera sp. TaxID=165188 RepID=UPI00260C85AB|nr:hypothetical protein [uncultured Megasphaera sp.]